MNGIPGKHPNNRRRVRRRDLLVVACRNLAENRLRSFLTLLGLSIGVMSLITVMTVIQAANDYVATRIANLGTNVFQVTKLEDISKGIDAFVRSMRRKDITWDHFQALRERVGSARRIGAQVSAGASLRSGENAVDECQVDGATANMADIGIREVADGRWFSEEEQRYSRRVCVIGDEIRTKLFPGVDPLGKELKINHIPYTVLGVCKPLGNIFGLSQDNFAVVPVTAFFKQFGSRRSLEIFVQTDDPQQFAKAMDEARIVLRAARGRRYAMEDDFTFLTSDTTIDLFHTITDNFFLVFLMLTAVAALVGGIVIMNIMLVSVTERTVEIGIRRAMGASRRDILLQFLTESVTLCVAGGALGVGSGFLAASALGRAAGMETSVRLWVAVFGVGLSSAIGMFFGLYPAWKAAVMDPVEALRHEH